MPLTARPLHDGWTVRATAGPVPAAITAAAPIAAEVPGCVHLDLMRAGLIPDPYLDDNEALLAWIGLVDWEYRGVFDVDAAALASASVHDLVFDGLDTVAERPELAGMGTTVSALDFVDDYAVIAHIGDSRIYLYRDDALTQITTDHTFVQRLVDSGRITPEEARYHPRRSVLMRVLGVRMTVRGAVPVAQSAECGVNGEGPGYMVCANHVSFIDIFILDAVLPCRFVAKKEIASWPVFGFISAHSQ